MARLLLDILGAALLAAGLTLATIGLYGLLRKPGLFDQLHAAGLITGPAIVLILLASVTTRNLDVITSAVLLILFLLITAPLSTQAIAQAAHRRALGDQAPAVDEDEPDAAR
jgi:multicomponent Na+:H+ antiporter subunit G